MLRYLYRPGTAGGAVLLAAVLILAPARAPAAGETGNLVLGLGYYNFDDNDDADDGAADFRLDYRHGRGLYFVKPWAGIEATSEGGVWGGGGLYIDISVLDPVVLTAAAGVGGYHNGGGRDLGHTVEFRTQGEATYRFDNGMRLGAAFSHISNASLGDDNPGVNIISAIYVIPLNRLIPD